MLEYLNELDKKLLLLINGCHSSFLDQVMFLASEKFFWVPFYILIVGVIILKHRSRWWMILITITLLILAADQLSSALIKPWAARLRPCHDESIQHLLHKVQAGCGGAYGFISSHAANSFALCTFLGFLSRHLLKIWLLFFTWAFLVSYSRVYLGVHYPGDVIGGALLGLVLGAFFYFLYEKVSARLDQQSNTNSGAS